MTMIPGFCSIMYYDNKAKKLQNGKELMCKLC